MLIFLRARMTVVTDCSLAMNSTTATKNWTVVCQKNTKYFSRGKDYSTLGSGCRIMYNHVLLNIIYLLILKWCRINIINSCMTIFCNATWIYTALINPVSASTEHKTVFPCRYIKFIVLPCLEIVSSYGKIWPIFCVSGNTTCSQRGSLFSRLDLYRVAISHLSRIFAIRGVWNVKIEIYIWRSKFCEVAADIHLPNALLDSDCKTLLSSWAIWLSTMHFHCWLQSIL